MHSNQLGTQFPAAIHVLIVQLLSPPGLRMHLTDEVYELAAVARDWVKWLPARNWVG